MNEQLPSEKLVKHLCGHDGCKGKGTYQVKVACINCSWRGSLQLTRGHEFSKYSQECPFCGCSQLMRAAP